MHSYLLDEIGALQEERLYYWRLERRTRDQILRLFTIEDTLVRLWRLRRSEMAGRPATDVHTPSGRGPGRRKVMWYFDD